MLIRIKKGLDLPIAGAPEQVVHNAPTVTHVAVVNADYVDLKPTMLVTEGDRVKRGQALYLHKKHPQIRLTAPGAGEVVAIHRGARRALQSVVIRLDADTDGGAEAAEVFAHYPVSQLASLSAEQVRDNLLASGQWAALRTRPFGKMPAPDSEPAAIFVTALDTNPLAADPAPLIAAEADAFRHGLTVLARLTRGKVWVCHAADAAPALPDSDGGRIAAAAFAGPHPAGLPGTHIHFLEPVDAHKTVWHLNYQDTIAIGKLFTTGRLHVERVVALGGPQVKQPCLLRTRLGASIDELLAAALHEGDNRAISGSVWSGRRAAGWAAYLGRHHLQLSVLAEGTQREFLGWLEPGARKFSTLNVMLSSLFRRRERRFDFTTTQNGSPRAMVPTGSFEALMPLDILPTQLLRYLLVGDTEMAQKLGCLELIEEDLALCAFACVGKHDYAPVLRNVLTQIEREG